MAEKKYRITIDCAPGYPRPDNVLQFVVAQLMQDNAATTAATTTVPPHALPEDAISAFQHVSSCFGEWVFIVDSEKHPWIESNLEAIGAKLRQCYEEGMIRYADWGVR